MGGFHVEATLVFSQQPTNVEFSTGPQLLLNLPHEPSGMKEPGSLSQHDDPGSEEAKPAAAFVYNTAHVSQVTDFPGGPLHSVMQLIRPEGSQSGMQF